MKIKKIVLAIFLISAVGFCISLYSLLHNQGFASGEFCTISDSVNCDVVNKGPYSQIAGVPVSLIGVIGYLFLAIASGMKLKDNFDRSLSRFLLLSSCAGFLFSLYLTSVEAFVLHSWCMLCVVSQIFILTILILSILISIGESKCKI